MKKLLLLALLIPSICYVDGYQNSGKYNSRGQQIVDAGGTTTAVPVNVVAGGAGDGSVLDGVTTTIKSTVRDYANANPIAVALTDANGDFAAAGAGTQYTQGDVDASITGTATLMEGAADTLLPIQGTVADGLLVNLGANNDVTVTSGSITVSDGAGALNVIIDSGTTAVTATNLDVQIGGSDTLTVTDGAGAMNVIVDSSALPTGAATSALQLPDGHNVTVDNGAAGAAVNIQDGGNTITVDGTLATTATDLDIRDLVFATDKVDTSGSTATVSATNLDVQIGGSDTVTVAATNLDVQIGGSDTVTVTDGAGAMNVIIDSGTTAVTATNLDVQIGGSDTLTVTDGAGAMNTIIDSGTVTTVSTVSLNSDIRQATASNLNVTVTDGSGALNTIIDSGTVTTVSTVSLNSDVRQGTASTLNAEVQGDAANASPVSGNPVLIAGRASNAVPTDVGADGDAVSTWSTRNGAAIVSALPHLGLVGAAPYTLTTHSVQYTGTQTGVAVITPTGGNRIVVTKVQIQVGGTTAGTAQLWFEASNGDTTYTRGTDDAIFDGEFAPSATLKPGVIMDGPWIGQAADFDLRFTDSAAINPITLTIWYYEITG